MKECKKGDSDVQRYSQSIIDTDQGQVKRDEMGRTYHRNSRCYFTDWHCLLMQFYINFIRHNCEKCRLVLSCPRGSAWLPLDIFS